jgi:hypothetical protein
MQRQWLQAPHSACAQGARAFISGMTFAMPGGHEEVRLGVDNAF